MARSKSKTRDKRNRKNENEGAAGEAHNAGTREEHVIPMFVALTTYFGYAILTIFGRLRDLFGRSLGRGRYFGGTADKLRAPLVASWDNFYTRRMYHRIQDVFSRPITGAPKASATAA